MDRRYTDEERRSDAWLCEIRRQAEERYRLTQRQIPSSPCPAEPLDKRDKFVFSPTPPPSSHGVCVNKNVFRPAFPPVVSRHEELLITPCMHTTKNNAWECGKARCCSRSHQAFNNVTRNTAMLP